MASTPNGEIPQNPGRSAITGVKRTSRSIPSTEAGAAAKRQKRQKKQKNNDNDGGQTLTRTEINARNQAMAVQRRDRAVETAQENRPENTKKTYKKAQKEWVSFCDKYQFEDGDHVNADKLIWFTQVVLTRRVKEKGRKQKKDAQQRAEDVDLVEEDRAVVEATVESYRRGILGPDEAEVAEEVEGNPLKHSTVEVWVSAIIDLYNVQIAKHQHSNPHPRGFTVRSALKDVQSRAWKRIRESHEDRVINTLLDAYTPEDLQNFVRHCWTAGTRANVDSYMRTLLDFLVGHFFLVRGEQRRVAELADMFVMQLPSESTSQECWCWVIVFDNGKTNSSGKKQYLGALRNRDFRICPIGALAMRRGRVRSPEDWDRIKLLRGGSDREHELNDKTHRTWIRNVMNAVGIVSSKSTHAGRKTGAQHAEILGVPEAEIRKAGKWTDRDSLNIAYLAHMPRIFMRTVAGHPLEGTYFNPRDTVKPPAMLKKRVFPEVEEGLANIRKAPSNLEERLSEVGFLRLMDFLRTVFLQDAALLRRSYPDHEIFKDGLFGTKAFAATNKNIQAVVPEISAMMAGMRQESSVGHSRTHSRIDEVAKDLKRVRRDVQLQSETLQRNSETLQRLCGAQIQIPALRIPAVQAQIVLPPVDQILAVPAAQVSESPTGPIVVESSGVDDDAPTEMMEPVAPVASSGGSAPQYGLDRTVTKVTELWEEWKFGRGLKPPVEELIVKWGTKWRAPQERGWFQRRQKLIDELCTIARESLQAEEVVAQDLEDIRVKGRHTLNWMCDHWVKQNRRARVTASVS
ncbi:Transcriptional activator of glycolytic enzymes domain containing protein [Elaphomyces granulatus]